MNLYPARNISRDWDCRLVLGRRFGNRRSLDMLRKTKVRFANSPPLGK
jgi:hypothetical protein